MKKNNMLMFLSVASLIVVLLGATFSYFAAAAKTDKDIEGVAANFGASVEITALYTGNKLIPMNDIDTIKGYEHECVDINGFDACQAYKIHVENTGDKFEYVGNINFDVTDIENLKYLVLDEDGNKYVFDTLITSGVNQSLGEGFELDNGESRDFVLIVWLSNLDSPQENVDADGYFSAAVTYQSSYGSVITGTFSN